MALRLMFIVVLSISTLHHVSSKGQLKRLLLGTSDDRLQQMEIQVQNLTQTVHLLQEKVNENNQHIAFYATLTAHTTLGQQQTVEFDKVSTNIGGAYNGISGIFTVPVTGLYHFSTTMLQMTSANNQIHTQIMKNSVEIGRNYGNENRSSGTMDVVVMAQKGDLVYVRHFSSAQQAIYGSGYSSFSGFLIG
ncbi:complement C1q tumor necrosis factor-related protein 3-like [Mytilus edulis]|uniref:C1q domain-containing protein n=1 Tax=Mytilus galloprovincialis TaxID=29158 RepID=A0A8B6G090_MYTGA|nr:Hypothetical predicted protein [Mytilus galloprovincialis]